MRTLRAGWERHTTALIVAFIVLSTAIFLTVGRPVAVLIAVGALNGLILPVSLGRDAGRLAAAGAAQRLPASAAADRRGRGGGAGDGGAGRLHPGHRDPDSCCAETATGLRRLARRHILIPP